MNPIGITIGDSSGVGPEILLKAAHENRIPVPYVVYGDLAPLARLNERYGLPLHAITSPAEYRQGTVNILDAQLLQPADLTPGRINAKSGHAAREYVIRATRAALAREVSAIVTLPMNKEATQLTDPSFTGHTELIGELCGSDDVTIMLASPDLIVTHVSTHCSLLQAIERCRQPRIQTIIELTHHAVKKLKPAARIAVAGLNPHAGENGLFGTEEIEHIAPAVQWARAQGWNVEGPHPPDTLFYMAVRRRQFDAVVCMYHDQGHIPSKLLDFEGGVNIALGLPIVRTSVDHGTAFDIAWKGLASTTSFEAAIDMAIRLAALEAVPPSAQP
ncbi:MAG: 4-hydroxythreonine-4-phosphate dehydrogenase PdxA [Bryobacterales bacterium]|nr:4-hydroxythreonine-4-phosphate dehydrogenase PdxA [Bryobacterales bacterium]